ncbi:MAG: class I tRNA ligase family protein, partial [archaeon]
MQEIYRKVILLLANTLSFYEMNANGNTRTENPKSANVLDQWIITRLHQTIRDSTEALDQYNTVNACRSLMGMIDDLSTWYV